MPEEDDDDDVESMGPRNLDCVSYLLLVGVVPSTPMF